MIPSRSHIATLPHVHHGAITPAEYTGLGMTQDALIDFSVSVNPYGPAPAVARAIASIDLALYPDPDTLALRRALARHLHRTPEHILPGNGSAELLWLIALAFLGPDDRALVVGPTFGEYARVIRLAGAQIETWRATPHDNFAIHPHEIATALRKHNPKVLFLCHPNNPTGQPFPLQYLTTWSDTYPQTLFVIDEAYIPFATNVPSAYTLSAPNILVLRSMTKAHALAGLRLGYAIAAPEIITALRQIQPPWSVNALAQVAGIAALQNDDYLQKTLKKLTKHTQTFRQNLQTAGWQPLPSVTNFFLLPVADAAATRTALLHHGIVVRDCTSFGLPRHIRIATRTPAQNARLLQALHKITRSP